MILLKLGTHVVPTDIISKYDVTFKKKYGAEEELESGGTYTEQTRSMIPHISFECANILEHDVDAIMRETAGGQFDVEYYYGGMKSAKMRVTKEPELSLKASLDDELYFDLSMELEG